MRKIYPKNYLVLFSLIISAVTYSQPIMDPIDGPTNVCSQPGGAYSYTASATNSPNSYSWSALPFGGVSFSSPGNAVTSVVFSYPYLNPTFTLFCYATNGQGSSFPEMIVVDVYETPSVTFSGAHSFCQGSSTNLSASSTMLSSSSTLMYNWSPPTGLSSTTGPNVNAQPPSTTNYTVLLTLGTCTNNSYLTITVNTCVVGVGSLDLPEQDMLSIYPNPSSSYFIVKSEKDESAIILNEIGQTVRSLHLVAGSETRISDLPGGIYFVITPTTRKKIIVTKE